MSSNNFSLTHSFFLDAKTAHNLDKTEGTSAGNFLSCLQTYIVEYDPNNNYAKLPSCLTRELGGQLASYVIFRDPNKNELEVRVTGNNNGMFFDRGWGTLKYMYRVPLGCWVSLTYVDPRLFLMRLTNRWGEEITYPVHNPPFKRLLNNPRKHVSNGRPALSSSRENFGFQPSFFRSYVKEMTNYDVHSGFLVLPWNGFGKSVFEFRFAKLVLVDYAGNYYHCNIGFTVDAKGEFCCRVSNGWREFCVRHFLKEGDKVRFMVNQPVHNYVMHVLVYPQVGIETTLSYRLSDGSDFPICISQQLFLAHS